MLLLVIVIVLEGEWSFERGSEQEHEDAALRCSFVRLLAGCDRMITQRQTQLSQEAEAKAREGNYAEAINLYEAALDGSARSADAHYKLALIYDDKMNDPLNALHHFKRFLALEPAGKRAQEVKGFMKRDELTLLTNLTGDSMVPRSEVVRLNNENLSLRKQIGERWAENKAAAAGKPAGTRSKNSPNEKAKEVGKRHYTVQRGRHARFDLAQVLQELGALAERFSMPMRTSSRSRPI